MVFSLSLIAIFVVVSIYYYFRAESLYRQLMVSKKELSQLKKDTKTMVDSLAVVAQKNEEFVKFRFNKLQNKDDEESAALLIPLVNNYAGIFSESIRGKRKMHKIAQKCCENHQTGSYKKLTAYIGNQEAHIKRMWSSNNVNGFMSFMEAMLVELEKTKEANVAIPN